MNSIIVKNKTVVDVSPLSLDEIKKNNRLGDAGKWITGNAKIGMIEKSPGVYDWPCVVLIENNIVVQKWTSKPLSAILAQRKGQLIQQAPDWVAYGCIANADGTYSLPAPRVKPHTEKRAEEFEQIDREFLEALAEKEMGRPDKMAAYLIKRQNIIDRHPNPADKPDKIERIK